MTIRRGTRIHRTVFVFVSGVGAFIGFALIGYLIAAARPEALSPAPASDHRSSRRLLPPAQPTFEASASPTRARRRWDDSTPEHCGHSERSLSEGVSGADLLAIDAAWHDGDFGRAADIAASFADLEDRRQILLPLFGEWAVVNAKAAAAFAQASPAGTERREYLETVIRTWTERDVAAASAWLDRLEPHPDHDGAVAVIATCEILCERHPEIALSWGESIGAADVRWEAICTAATAWARYDAPAAQRYIETAAILSADERVRMLEHVRSWAAPLTEDS